MTDARAAELRQMLADSKLTTLTAGSDRSKYCDHLVYCAYDWQDGQPDWNRCVVANCTWPTDGGKGDAAHSSNIARLIATAVNELPGLLDEREAMLKTLQTIRYWAQSQMQYEEDTYHTIFDLAEEALKKVGSHE